MAVQEVGHPGCYAWSDQKSCRRYRLLGYEYAVVEGFKEEWFSGAVLGDLATDNCNPDRSNR